MTEPWLSIVGIGEDGAAGLSARARACVAEAALVFGGQRHLTLAATLLTGEAHPWPSPLDAALDAIVQARGRKVCVLASGDPFLHGIGVTLCRRLPIGEMRVLPAPSAFSLAASRLGWSLSDVTTLSLHGRPIELVLPHLQPDARLLLLTSDAAGPAALAALLATHGFGASTMSVMEALGGPRERVREVRAEGFGLVGIDPLNAVALRVSAASGARVIARAPGLPDALFEHDGQITKRAVRAMTLSALAPRRGELLWDIGAGSGSVGIEWLLTDPSLRALAMEARPDRAARIGRNALVFGVPHLQVVEGRAPDAFAGLSTPDAVFVGGGASREGVLDALLARLRPGGRLVVNAVTLESEAVLLARRSALGGELLRLSVCHADPVAGMTGWRPAMPVTQWVWEKPQ